MGEFNKYGLSRTIPAEVKRQVRQKCGFGCVVCASPIVEYEHVEPTFALAKEHSPDAITLLCPTCHAKVTRRIYSKEKIKKAMLEPAALKIGKITDKLDFSDDEPLIQFAGQTFINCQIPVMFEGEPLLQVEKEDDAILISGRFYDSKGKLSLEIIRNEWVCGTGSWDITVIGPEISVIEKNRGPRLVLLVEPPKKLIIKRFDMLIRGVRLFGNADRLRVGNLVFSNSVIVNGRIGFNIN
ncbi:hypothetical protein SMX71_003883 [Cronobacter dublinensis]|uniref:HNH endonuclease n=1 Tax=Cronobacter universalis NCTC 9529 TaxID=1074000 RepID=A0AAC8VSK7_9ENTR|nr:hypothetical protein [Cronobacter universalis]EKM6459525.1 hypothetical protein [Cronobacter dublinensis]TWR32411.1 HNH endonuclease [Cronobacter sakazakii]ALB56175.1 hypothetical protein AFK65_16460 [Cronobacter universalis NCTC 9529]ELY3774189.1 hypothetical protein [Cronobacter dublinensis]ELY4006697.1 hypothetical protein [Cronobacter dublinensis]